MNIIKIFLFLENSWYFLVLRAVFLLSPDKAFIVGETVSVKYIARVFIPHHTRAVVGKLRDNAAIRIAHLFVHAGGTHTRVKILLIREVILLRIDYGDLRLGISQRYILAPRGGVMKNIYIRRVHKSPPK